MAITSKSRQEIIDGVNAARVHIGLPPIPMFMEPSVIEGMTRSGTIQRYDNDSYLTPVRRSDYAG